MHRLGRCVAHTYKAWSSLRRTGCINYPRGHNGKLFNTSQICLDKSDPASGPKIRWYNQMYDGLFKRQRPDSASENVEEDLPEAKLLKKKIDEIDEELRELSGERGSVVEPLLHNLSKEERDRFHTALRESESEETDEPPTDQEIEIVEKVMMEVFPEELMKDMRSSRNKALLSGLADQMDLLPDEYMHIRRFNNDLGRAADRPSIENYRKQAWRSYIRCKEKVPSFLPLVPDAAWNALWASQVHTCQDSPERTERLIVICSDMQRSGKDLTHDQKVLLLEALILKGRHAEALTYWESQKNLLNDQSSSTEYNLIGVRLFALQGNPRKAQQIALDILAEGGEGISRILVPVIEAWVRSGGDIGTRHAWAVYLYLRAQLGPDIKPDDYDKVAMGFLKAGRTDFALAVFKDLMLMREKTKYESTELYKTSIGLVGKLHSKSISLTELTNISLTALTVLPRKFQNKYFYGSWIKRLIGMGETDAAVVVVDLMYERGVKPAAIHLNGIIGAWLRSGRSDCERKAEQLGWAMIHERLDLVRQRSGENISTDADLQAPSGTQVPLHIRRTVCPATIETFALLLLSYERRRMLKHVQLLRDYLPRAEIPPNTYFMNHLIYAELRHARLGNARKIYLSWCHKVPPDLATFAALWDCEKASLNRISPSSSTKFPPPRRLMCEMMTWYSKLSAKHRQEVRKIFSKDLYDQIIRCFCLAHDLEGTLVALYGLKESFGFTSDPDTARMITLQVTSMGMNDAKASGRRRPRLSSNPQHKANISRITRVLELLIEQRGQILQDRGITLDETGLIEEQLYLIAELLRTVLRRTTPDPIEMERGIEKAAWEMGVSGVRMLDPHPSVPTTVSSKA
jgi:hypothetical protein